MRIQFMTNIQTKVTTTFFSLINTNIYSNNLLKTKLKLNVLNKLMEAKFSTKYIKNTALCHNTLHFDHNSKNTHIESFL